MGGNPTGGVRCRENKHIERLGNGTDVFVFCLQTLGRRSLRTTFGKSAEGRHVSGQVSFARLGLFELNKDKTIQSRKEKKIEWIADKATTFYWARTIKGTET